MQLRFDEYAADPEVRGPARNATNDALRRVIDYYLYRDLQRGWRVTAPNLEDCGLLAFDYEGLQGDDGLLGEAELWEHGFSVRADRETRAVHRDASTAARLLRRNCGRSFSAPCWMSCAGPSRSRWMCSTRRNSSTSSSRPSRAAGGHRLVSRGCSRTRKVRGRLPAPEAAAGPHGLLRLFLRRLRPLSRSARWPLRAAGTELRSRRSGSDDPLSVSRAEALRHRRAGAQRRRSRATRSTPTPCAGCRQTARSARWTAHDCWRPAKFRPRSTATSSNAIGASSI